MNDPTGAGSSERERAKRGTVCQFCWHHWNMPHDKNRCRDTWEDDGVLTVCICGCTRG